MDRRHGTASRRVFLAGGCLALAGCGFHPVYASRDGRPSVAQEQLAMVDVGLIPERSGQLLRQALQQRFDGAGLAMAKRYTLAIGFGISADAIAIQRDTTATRVRELGTATWFLKRLDPASTLVTSGVAKSLDGLDVIDQQYFAQDLENENAQRRIANNVADQITLQLAAYFARHPQAA